MNVLRSAWKQFRYQETLVQETITQEVPDSKGALTLRTYRIGVKI